MAGEPTDLDNNAQADADALAAFESGYSGAETTTTPPAEPQEQPDQQPQASEPPKPFSVSEADWQAVQSKLSKLDMLDEYGRKIDTVAGNLGGLKQQIEQVRQRGATKIEKAQLKRLSESYPELAEALGEDLSAILSAPAGAGIDPEDLDKRVQDRVQAALAADRVERQKEWLNDKHPDWVDTLRSQEFRAYQLTLTPTENEELMKSVDGKVVAKHLTAFKELKAQAESLKTKPPAKPQATPAPTAPPRNKRMEAAVPAKGTGGAAPGPDPADDFNAGYALKGKA